MTIQKINIVLFGSGKVGSGLVNKILSSQELLLQSGIDLRISVVISSSLVFIEKETVKNAWDVTFVQSSRKESVANWVSYIQENDFSNTIIVDAIKGFDIISYYTYFLQNTFDVVSINAEINTASQSLLNEIKISSEVYSKKFFKLASTSISKEEAVEIAFDTILEISKKKNQTLSTKQAS